MNHESQCKICQYGPDRLDWSSNNTVIAEEVDCSEASVRRHRKWVEVNGFQERTATVTTSHEFPDTGIPGSWKPRRSWQTPSGDVLNSFEFIPDSDAIAHVDNDRIDSLILDWDVMPSSNLHGETEIACPADLQLGKSERGLGTAATITKFRESLERVAQRWERNQPREGYLCDLGDLIENQWSVASQVSTNDRTLPEQVEDAVALYMNAIGRLLPLTGKLFFATVTSNHGEARTGFKNNPYDSENDWGLMIQRLIEGKCADRGWDVTFIRPDTYEDTATFVTADGTSVALTHGHHSNTPARMKDWVKGQIVGKRPGYDATLWVHGHYHSTEHFTLGNGIHVFGTPSLDPGSAWYTKKTGESSRQGIVALTVNNGDWFNYSIL